MIEITAAMVRQYERRELGLYDPCIICKGEYLKCGHMDSTPALIKRLKNLGVQGRKAILDKDK